MKPMDEQLLISIKGLTIEPFRPTAYYDRHMDCIHVRTQDVSVTEHRITPQITIHESNNKGEIGANYVGFTIKGIRHVFDQNGIPLSAVYTLAEVIDRLVAAYPGSTMSEALRLVYKQVKQDAGGESGAIERIPVDMDDGCEVAA